METPVMGGEDMGYVGGAEMANAGEAEKENAAAEPHAVEEEDGVRAKRTSRPTSERENRKRSNKSARGDTNPSRDTFQEKIPTNVPQYRFTPVYPDPRGVMLSPYDRAPQLRLSDENLTVAGHKGYRLVRATHGTKTGAWYCEATIREDVPEPGLNERFTKVPGNSRIGWTRGSAYMQAPIGYDRFGYCLCSSNGDVVQREGDVTDGGGVAKVAAGAGAKTGRDVLEWKGTKKYYYLDEDRDIQEDVHPVGSMLAPRACARADSGKWVDGAGSTIRFYINGEAQGVAFSDIQVHPAAHPTTEAHNPPPARNDPPGAQKHSETPPNARNDPPRCATREG
ncbi:hypothetical protein T484DRAFT_1751314, partial [Baffinella frigidus]